GSSLAANVDVYLDDDLQKRYADAADELRFFFITSTLDTHPVSEKPADAVRVELDGENEAWVAAHASGAAKCVRCWHYRDDIGSHAGHPELCGRCVENIEGEGETRQWF